MNKRKFLALIFIINFVNIFILTSLNQNLTFLQPINHNLGNKSFISSKEIKEINATYSWMVSSDIALYDTNTSDIVHITWIESVGSKKSIFYANNSDNFEYHQNITHEPSEILDQKISVDSNNIVHIVWHNHKLYEDLICYTNSSDNFMTNITISQGDSNGNPDIVIDSKNIVHIVWNGYVSGSSSQIFYSNSSDEFTTNKTISQNPNADYKPSIAVDNNDIIHVVWKAYINNFENNIYYSNSSDNFLINRSITKGLGYYENPKIAIDSNNAIHIVWSSEASKINLNYYTFKSNLFFITFDWDIFYANSYDNFNNIIDISILNLESDRNPSIFVDKRNEVHIVWTTTISNYWWVEGLPFLLLDWYFEVHYWSSSSQIVKKFYRDVDCSEIDLVVSQENTAYFIIEEFGRLLLINNNDFSLFIPQYLIFRSIELKEKINEENLINLIIIFAILTGIVVITISSLLIFNWKKTKRKKIKRD